jgi:hypothetical protein
MDYFQTKKSHPNAAWKPWSLTKGPVTYKGKLKVSKNAVRHGYYSEMFREFRRNKRSTETIRFEKKCLKLIRAADSNCFEVMDELISELSDWYLRLWKKIENGFGSVSTVMEIKYISTLYEKTVRYSLSVILKNLNLQLKEQNGN